MHVAILPIIILVLTMLSKLFVTVVPDGIPVVTVDRAGLEHGGPLIADCSSPASYPAANLTWYVNDQRVSYFLQSFSLTAHP